MRNKTHRNRYVPCLSMVIVFCILATVFLCAGTPVQAKTYLKIGILGEPKSLNPFQTADAWTRRVTSLLYQPLYLINPGTSTLIPWLAKDQPVYDPQRKTVTFQIRQMNWDDGTEFSAEDVIFTANVFKRFRIPRYYDYWKFVTKIEALDRKTIRLTIERPMAILHTRTLTSWVVQREKWEPVIKKAENKFKEKLNNEKKLENKDNKSIEAVLQEALSMIQTHVMKTPTGLGPFKFIEWQKGSHLTLQKNIHFFGKGLTIAGHKLGPYIDMILFKVYDSQGSATLALKNGSIDFLWKGVSHSFIKELDKDPNIKLLTTLDNGYRYLGFNLRKAPMSDPAFRHAVAYLIDKDFIIDRIVHRYGQRLDSVIPPGNTFYFNPDTPHYGKGMDRSTRIKEAYTILTESGYRWEKPPVDSSGSIQTGHGLIMPNGKPAPPLTILTPLADYDIEMAAPGNLIQEWVQDIGINISWKPVAFANLLHKVRNQRDFDMYIMGWRGLSDDPDYLRRFFHSSYDIPGNWNYTGYNNVEFERLADLQIKTMDVQARRKIVLELQKMLMKDLPYIPLFVPFRLEGIRTDRFEGWTEQVGGVGNTWSFCLVKPKKN